ncbi:MAG TPA: pyridoxamine 5'-phosphate oxidase family protein [Iamia sp.]|nr:pyridoxamine 5'-phosphate oxidase family protein [Iamia sp.]
MRTDRNGLEVLERDECLALLATSHVGRVGVSIGALPTVLPVSYRLVGEQVLFRTGVGSKLDAATVGAVIAFEVDDVDPIGHEGWSVVVTGVASVVEPESGDLPLPASAIPHWPVGEATRVLALPTGLVSGRRLTHRAVV